MWSSTYASLHGILTFNAKNRACKPYWIYCSIYIYNYVFYPSAQGNNEINLVKNSLSKIQAFHTAFGEDNQIYSTEEIVPLSNSACKMIPARYESYFRQNIIENY